MAMATKEHLCIGSICSIMMYDILYDSHGTGNVSSHSINRNYLSVNVVVDSSGGEVDSVFVLKESHRPPYVWQPQKQAMRFSFLYEDDLDKLIKEAVDLCSLAVGQDDEYVLWNPASIYDVWAISTFALTSVAEKAIDGYIGHVMCKNNKTLDDIFSDLVLESSVSSVLASRLSFHLSNNDNQLRPTQVRPVRVYCWNYDNHVVLIPIGFEGKCTTISVDCLDRIGSILSPKVGVGFNADKCEFYDTSKYHYVSEWICQNLLQRLLSVDVVVKYDDYIGSERCYLCEKLVGSKQHRRDKR